MPRDSNGNYTPPQPNVVTGTPIQADGWANPTVQDIANELTNSLSRDGQGGMRAPFRNADGTQATPGVTFDSEPTSGLYRAGNGDLRIAINGQDIARWDSAGLALWNGTSWDLINAGGANYYSRLDADTAFAANQDYATISNVQPGFYKYEGVALIDHDQTNYDATIDFGIGPAIVNGATAGTASSKYQTVADFSTLRYYDRDITNGTLFSAANVMDAKFATSFVANPVMSIFDETGFAVDALFTCSGLAEITSAGDVSWRAFTTPTGGWNNVQTGTYIILTKVG